MKKINLVLMLATVVAIGCGDDTEGTGGTGGTPSTTIFWSSSNLRIVGDDCDFFDASEQFEYRMTISGSDVTLEDTATTFEVSTDDYDPVDDAVLLTNSVDNDDFFPCVAQLDDAMELVLDDPSVSLEDNDTVEVSWTHVEEDASDVPGECEGEWFVDLPCSGELTMTLTQDLQ